MKFFSLLALGAFAAVASAQETSASDAPTSAISSPVPEATNSPYVQCVNNCDPTDVNCRAGCSEVPYPDESQVNATTTCVASCDQGDGSAESIQAYTNCVNGCISDNYLSTSGSPSSPTSSPNGNNDNSNNDSSSNNNNNSDSDSTGTGVNKPSSSGSDTSETSAPNGDEGAASTLVGSSIGLLGLLALAVGVAL